jgi:uncharacterized CHY-type Zn-finger protein
VIIMSLRIPDSMDEVVYWTSRKVDEGHVKAWAFREDCPKCHKGLMGKPVDEKGKVKIRATYYECPECGNTIDKGKYEDTLTCNVIYICPYCKHKGRGTSALQKKNL